MKNNHSIITLTLLCLSVCLSTFIPSQLFGQIRKFPYQAVVQSADLEARSGPGRSYYATDKLSQGEQVIVHRHDPGGWYQISPVASSFSWVRAQYVQKGIGNTGTINANQVVVRVGSSLNDGMSIEQRRLMKGDAVQIMGQQEFSDSGRRTVMYKIKPPAQEFRWVKGDFVVPTGQAAQMQRNKDPYAYPNGTKPPAKKGNQQVPQPLDGPIANHFQGQGTQGDQQNKQLTQTTRGDAAKDRNRLNTLDDNFRSMIKDSIDSWDLSKIRNDYEHLKNETNSNSLLHQLELRLASVDRYSKIKEEHDSFVQLTNETARRDAQLLQLRSRGVSIPNPDLGLPSQTPLPRTPSRTPQKPTTFVTPPLSATGQGATGQGIPGNGQRTTQQLQPPVGKMSGAGIVQRARWRPGQVGPTHMLVAPKTGRLLAYLHPKAGIQLDQYIGRSMGLYGRRVKDPRIGGDVIVVENLAPVRLTP